VGTPIWFSAKIVVFKDPNFLSHDAYVACLRATGHRVILARIALADPPTTQISSFQANVTWLLWLTFSGDPSLPTSSISLHTINAATSRRGPTVKIQTSPDGLQSSTVPMVDGNDALEQLVVTSNGDYAWLVSDRPAAQGQTPVDALYTADRHGGVRQLDLGPADTLTHLQAHGTRITWIRQGTKQSISLS
jgi:hypothetical protein